VAGRTIAIGDIHGCAGALAALLDAISPVQEDTLVPLGDFIDCGPDSRQVFDQLIALSRRCRLVPILGNHEEMLLAAGQSLSALKEWLFCGGKQTLASYGASVGTAHPADILLSRIIPEEHWRFVTHCCHFFETPTHIFTHAGYLPDVPMEQQPGKVLRWEFVNPKTVRPHRSGKVVIVGHTAQRDGEILDLGYLKCLDTACEPGQWLTALDVGAGRVWQANKRGELRKHGESR
jgi:serine/threonine protein phosphatase 1